MNTEPIVSWVESHLGRVSSLERLGDTSWRVQTEGRDCVVKLARSERAFEQETRALKLASSIQHAVRTPSVLFVSPPLRLIAQVWLGEVTGGERPRPIEARALGSWLAQLHAFCLSEDPVHLRDALALRWSRATASLELMHHGVPDEPDWRVVSARRVLCHRDFWSRNWLVGGGQVAVIDFEHARDDHPATDFVRWWWTSPEPIRRAFEEGYGTFPFDRDELHALGRLYVVQTLAWAARNKDLSFVEHAEQVRTAMDA